ncbi:MAG: BrnA antitoxin family protein [Syntrophobacteraceae bacterium]|nr:BrnA antitoxin family protein [Syntrophobacteraceae bacterium]
MTDKDNHERTEKDFQHTQPACEKIPELFEPQLAAEMLRSRGRPKAGQTKTHVSIRLDADVLEAFKATARGWQTRINRALREWLKEQSKSRSA